MQASGTLLLVHYSCESFVDIPDGRSPRVTSIAVRNIASGQTDSFSLHLVAERMQLEGTAGEPCSEAIERTMMADFYDFAVKHSMFTWIHWNMRDAIYGFPALEHRFRVLGGTPVEIPSQRRVDLANLLIDLYSPSYIDHPRLYKLLELNQITPRHLLNGDEEAAAYRDGSLVSLHFSTLAKIEALHTILLKAWHGELLHRASRADRYGTAIGGWIEDATDHWLFRVFGIVGIIASLIGLVSLF